MTANWPVYARFPAVVVLALMAMAVACGGGGKLKGTNLDATPAPDFTLQDEGGARFSLSDYRGKAVLVTFLYTHCPDVCPAIAGKLSAADAKLGSASTRVAFVAVSVDPDGDTPASVAQFTADHNLGSLGTRWRYGLGTKDELAAVWKDYFIGAEPEPAAIRAQHPGTPGPDVIDHDAAMYLIDPQGRERLLVRPDITIPDLVRDLKLLAGG